MIHIRHTYFIGKILDCAKNKGWFFGHFMDKKLLRSNMVEIAYQNISGKQKDPQDAHYHKNSIEINIVISGHVTLEIANNFHEVKSGEFYVIYPYTTVENVTATKNTRLVVIRTPSLPLDKISVRH